MRELGRIFSRRRFLLSLAAILLINGVLFVREQRKMSYGLDLELPRRSVFYFSGAATLDAETVDARAAYGRYLEYIDRVRDMPIVEALDGLTAQKEALTEKIGNDTAGEDDKLSYAAVNNVLKRLEYLAGYGDWLDAIRQNRDNLLTFSIFNDPDSFSGRNIVKTAGEFELLRGVELRAGADGAVEALLTFTLSDYLLLLILLLAALSFLEERKAGLWSVVHAASGGRLRLGLSRAAILLAVSVLAVLAIYGTDLAAGLAIYGDADLGRAAQSVEALGRLPERWTVGGFLGRFFLLRAASAYLVALALWLLLSAVNNVKYTVIVCAAALAAEYSLYALLPVQSAFNVLKYFNIFTYISLSDLYTNYLNIDIFGWPLGIRIISQWALAPLVLISASGCVAVQCLKRPAAGRDLLGRAAYAVNTAADSFLRRLGMFGMELYKSLWIQKGVVVAAVLIYASAGLEHTVSIPIFSAAQRAAAQYTKELSGPVDDGVFARLDEISDELTAAVTAGEEAQAAFDAGELEYPEYDAIAREASAAKISLEGLNSVRDRAQELRDLGERVGLTLWLLDETPFESVYGDRARTNQDRAAVLAALALALLLSGAAAFEGQSGMTALLRSTPRGRSSLASRKLLLAAAAAVFVWAAVYGPELYALLSEFPAQCLAAPIRSLPALSELPLPCSVASALALLYALRLLMLICGAVLALFVSGLFRRPEIACVACAGALVLPSLLYAYVHIDLFGALAYILPLEVLPLLLPSFGAPGDAALRCGALLALSALAAASILASGCVRRRR